jgi:hypothetical protein
MKSYWERVLAAYQPMRLNGLLMDGQYRLPRTASKQTTVDLASPKETSPNAGRRHAMLAAALVTAFGLGGRSAITSTMQAKGATTPGKPSPHSAPHDFDFFFGTWKIHNHRLKERLVGSSDWENFEAIQTCRPILGGMGNQDEFVTDEFGDTHFVGTSIRLFDPVEQAWSIYWADNRSVQMQLPVKGSFKDGVGTFFGRDVHKGKPVLARFIWSNITPSHARWEQALSIDEGETWEVNWIMVAERIAA